MSVTVRSLVPHEMVLQQPTSSSAHVLRKRQVEILPSENTNFSFTSNDRIVINISSQTEFLNAQDNYLRGNITSVLTDGGVDESARALDEGGVMACFRTVELRTQSGVLIERWDRSNRLYAMISNATHPRGFVESAMGSQFDSVGYSADELDPYSSDAGNTTYVAARRRISGGVAGTAQEFTMKIPLGFLNMNQYIPLMLIKQGLQLIFELDRPEFAQNSHGDIAGALVSDITLSNVRYVASMITPDETVVQQYISKYSTDGLNYTFESWRHRRKTIDQAESSGASLSYQFGVRSARAVFSVIQSALLSDSASSAAQDYDSISTFLSTGIQKYQYRSGAEEYPYHEVDLSDGRHSEAYDQLMLAVNQFGSKIHETRFLPYQWGKNNTVNGVANESTKLILAADLSRANSPWSGLDLSINNLDLELEFNAVSNATFGNRVVHTYVLHDVMLSLSQDQGVVVRK